MKKLFKLRTWLSLDEAAESLSVLFGETVTRAELLRLALDRKFTLSVRFLNAVYAKGGPIISSGDVRRKVIPGLKDGEFIHIAEGIFLDENRVIDMGQDVKPLVGLWDLPMIGAEELDVEHEYQMLTGGASVDATCLEGPFVCDRENYWQLQEHFSNNEYFKPEDLKEPRTNPANFYPAAMLPSDAVLVVRPESLAGLIARVQAADREGLLTSSDQAAQPVMSENSPPRVGGRRMSNLWPGWVAELALHLHENGFPQGEGAAGQDALIAAVEERLIQQDRDAPSRTTVQETVRAVLIRYRAAGN